MKPSVKALFFDMFGTMLDWRSSVARETRTILEPRGYSLDWPAASNLRCGTQAVRQQRTAVSNRYTASIPASSPAARSASDQAATFSSICKLRSLFGIGLP